MTLLLNIPSVSAVELSPNLDAINLRISEIFYSLQGETSRIGLPTVFIRLTGCPLRCGYCDSEYAFYGGARQSIAHILQQVSLHRTPYVTVTGGEPLAQKNSLVLLKALCDAGYSVSLETSGALPIAAVDKRVARIMDIKTPDSGELSKMHWQNLQALRPSDEIKFVLCSEADYQWARALLHEKNLSAIAPVIFSPVFNQVSPRQLAEWVLRDHLPVRVQVQLHKLLWGEVAGV